jgi:plasminogen activator inhibitor 1 RNA-binding protein
VIWCYFVYAVRESMNYGAPAPGRGRGGSSGDRTSPRREFGDGDTNVVQGRYSGGGLGDDGVVRREDGEAKASERGHGLRQPYCDGYTGGDYMR